MPTKFSNLRDLVQVDNTKIATVDVIDWFGLRTRTIKVFQEQYSCYWRFLDTGEYTYGNAMENLYKAYQVKQLCNV